MTLAALECRVSLGGVRGGGGNVIAVMSSRLLASRTAVDYTPPDQMRWENPKAWRGVAWQRT